MLDLIFPDSKRSQGVQLALLGFITLFLELVLIRFLAGNIWNLGYFPNLVLIAVFAGMGLGFVFHRLVSDEKSPLFLFFGAMALLLLVGLVVGTPLAVPGFDSSGGVVGGELYFSAVPKSRSEGSSAVFLIWFFAVVLIFFLISQRTAKLFTKFEPLTAYTLDIAGALSGIVAFLFISWFELPAYTWFLCLIPPMLLASGTPRWSLNVGILASILLCAFFAWKVDGQLLYDTDLKYEMTVKWSPYQKVEYVAFEDGRKNIFVNGISHQAIKDEKAIRNTFYQIPHHHRQARKELPPYRRVLIIGAGASNDVAAALLNGAEHIDAVEIDPAIARFGKKYHPLQAYSDPRVNLIVDDGRAFLTNAREKYDLIIFALTDSLVKVSPMAQLRLENYIFTVEAFRKAYELLSESGEIVLYNQYRQPWLFQKLREMVLEATGRYPQTLWKNAGFSGFLVGRVSGVAPPEAEASTMDLAVDDWPFLYLKERGIPPLYARAMAGFLGLVLLLFIFVRRFPFKQVPAGLDTSYFLKFAFLLMGIAFLLLETKGIIQFSLLFGTTWLNNALVFMAVLTLVLLANWTAVRWRNPKLLWIASILLIGSTLFAFVFPLSKLLGVSSLGLRYVLASLLIFSPIYFANLVFSVTFRDQELPEQLFGWNLLGAMCGGLAEYMSMWTGYGALALVVAMLYSGVLLCVFLDHRQKGRDTMDEDFSAPLEEKPAA